MKFSLLVLLTFTLSQARSQRIGTDYRTVSDNQMSHYLTFVDKVNCKLIFPAHGHVVMTKRMEVSFTYKLSGDTTRFFGDNLDTTNLVQRRFLNSRFIVKSDKILYDIVSGYPYVDARLINNKYTTYSIDGEIYRQNSKHKAKGRLKRKLKEIGKNKDLYSVNVLKGKSAYEKYGLVGMNGVIEIAQKK